MTACQTVLAVLAILLSVAEARSHSEPEPQLDLLVEERPWRPIPLLALTYETDPRPVLHVQAFSHDDYHGWIANIELTRREVKRLNHFLRHFPLETIEQTLVDDDVIDGYTLIVNVSMRHNRTRRFRLTNKCSQPLVDLWQQFAISVPDGYDLPVPCFHFEPPLPRSVPPPDLRPVP